MLEVYKESQSLAYTLIKNSIINNKLSHAYLVDIKDCVDGYDFIMAFVKTIICNDFVGNNSINIDDLCRRIDEGNYLELKIIEPDSLWIKKEQLLELQGQFSKSAVEGNTRVYVIKEAEKMNMHAANSILKFLEEPVDNIVAILVTNNIGKMLSTIVSRCQLITLNNSRGSNDNLLKNLIDACFCNDSNVSAYDLDIIEFVVSFIDYYETYGNDVILYSKNIWHSKFCDRDKFILGVDLIINFYYDVLKWKCGKKICFFVDNVDLVERVSQINELSVICKKINVLINIRDLVKYNLNLNLLFDRMILELGGE